jgi:C1A family cysteine protease
MKKYTWKPDLPDHRDFTYSATTTSLPQKVDLIGNCPHVYDQGDLGSCTGNAIAAAIEYEQIKKMKANHFTPSRLFIYYNERLLEGTVKNDSGAMIRDGMKTVNKQGVCKETTWPYITTKFASKPTKRAYAEGMKFQTTVYSRVDQTLDSLKACLASGDPIVFGFSVYESFESSSVALTGVLNLPEKTEKLLGGHAVLCIGYDDETKRFKARNSWGADWGMSGYFTMPYEYLTNDNLATDFWVIKDIEI